MRSALSSGGSRANSVKEFTPSRIAAERSSPAENARPSPRTTTTRTSPGRSRENSLSANHISGVCALSTSGRDNVTVATGPSHSSRTPLPEVIGGYRQRHGAEQRKVRSRLLTAPRAAPLTELNAGLREHAVHEPVGT